MNKIGRMRHYIAIQELTTTTDPVTGVQSETWADKYSSVPASFRAMSARELQAAGARQSEASVEFEIRADFTVDAGMRIVLDGDIYDVEEPLLDPTRQRFLRIRAKRGITNG